MTEAAEKNRKARKSGLLCVAVFHIKRSTKMRAVHFIDPDRKIRPMFCAETLSYLAYTENPGGGFVLAHLDAVLYTVDNCFHGTGCAGISCMAGFVKLLSVD